MAGEKVIGPEWLTSLYNNSSKSDIEIHVTTENGPPALFSAHRFVLIHQSEVFEKMLEPGKFVEGVSGRVTISDVKPFVFQYILRFLYTSELPEYVNFGELLDLLKAAHFYQLHKLQMKCIGRLRDFSVTELCKVYEVCILLDLPEELKEKCLSKMIKNGPLIMKNDLHFELSETSLQSLLASKFWCEPSCMSQTEQFHFQPHTSGNSAAIGPIGFTFSPYQKPQTSSDSLSSTPNRITEKEVFNAVVRWAKWRCILNGKELSDEHIALALRPLHSTLPIEGINWSSNIFT